MKIKKILSLTLMTSLAFELVCPVAEATIGDSNFPTPTLISRDGGRGGRGGRSGGGGGARANRGGGGNRRSSSSMNRSDLGGKGSGRVNRDRASRPSGERRTNSGNLNLNRDRAGSNRVERQAGRDRDLDRTRNVSRDREVDRTRNVSRDRDFDLNADRNYSNRVNRNLVNIDRNNVVVNPRGWGAWGWNNGRAWAPNYSYWGGGFWGAFAAGAAVTGLTSAAINAATADDEPTYVVIDSNSPGNTLFTSYGLTQIACSDSDSIVAIYGPQESVVCANPNSNVPAGIYDVNPSDLTLVLR